MAGKIVYIAPVDYGQGKIFGKKNKWIAVKRRFGDKQKGCAYGGDRSTPVSAAEQQHRSLFGTIAKKVTARLKDSSPTFDADSLAFLQQKEKGGYQRMRQWLWADEMSKL